MNFSGIEEAPILNSQETQEAIRKSLSDDLLKPQYRNAHRPFAGHCYVASEAYYHLMGGALAGLKVKTMRHEGSPHWWIEDMGGNIIDLTKEQFETPVPYEQGKGKGFLTKRPSKRAVIVMERAQKHLRKTASL